MTAYDRKAEDRVISFLKTRLTAGDFQALDSLISTADGYNNNSVAFDKGKGTTIAEDRAFAERYPGAEKIRVTGA